MNFRNILTWILVIVAAIGANIALWSIPATSLSANITGIATQNTENTVEPDIYISTLNRQADIMLNTRLEDVTSISITLSNSSTDITSFEVDARSEIELFSTEVATYITFYFATPTTIEKGTRIGVLWLKENIQTSILTSFFKNEYMTGLLKLQK